MKFMIGEAYILWVSTF